MERTTDYKGKGIVELGDTDEIVVELIRLDHPTTWLL
jgi:hypothetical protein